MKNNIEFSLIFACYNEEENLKKTIRDSVLILRSLFRHFEIIIVEDKSTDKSPQIVDRLAKQYQEVNVIYNPINLGQGISFLIGLESARGKLMMQNGVDRPFDLSDLKKILPLFPKFDIVVVARVNRSAYSIWRKLTSWGNIILRWLFFGREFDDLNFVQIYKRKVIEDIKVLSRSAAFVTQEIVLKAKKKGYKIIEIKLPYYQRPAGVSHHGKKRDVLWALIDMINFWLEFKAK